MIRHVANPLTCPFAIGLEHMATQWLTPAVLKAMIAALQAENAKMSATLRAHDLLVQALRIRIAKLKKQKFGASSEKIEREIEQLELALEDLMVATAEADDTPPEEDEALEQGPPPAEEAEATPEKKQRRRPRVSKDTPRERRELDPGDACPDCGGDLRVVRRGGCQRAARHDRGADQGDRGGPGEEILPSLRAMVQEPAPSRPIPRSMAGPACWPSSSSRSSTITSRSIA